jgi:hypothetical protein
MMWVYCAFLCHFQMPCAMFCIAGPFFRKLYEIWRIQLHETQPLSSVGCCIKSENLSCVRC